MVRRLTTLVALILVGLGGLLLAAPRAHAAAGDVFDSFDVVYDVGTDGVLTVQETIVLRFGSSSGRHGLERSWVTRERYDDDSDATYDISDISVTSPSPGVSTSESLSSFGSGRDLGLRLRVGDANTTISADTATYVLTYRVTGALRTFSGYDELYWDATGTAFPTIDRANLTVTVPGGAQAVTCNAGPPRATGGCATADLDGPRAVFAAADLAPGDILTIGVKIGAGLIADNKPHLSPNAELASQRFQLALLGASGVGSLAVPFLGWLYYRRHSADRRFQGLPPGVVPGKGQPAQEVWDPGLEVPVSFAPPRLPLADAGLLLEGQSQVRHTSATLVALAAAGAIRLRAGDQPQAVQVDPGKATDPQQQKLLRSLFKGRSGTVDLDEPGVMAKAHDKLVALAADDAKDGRWFVRRSAWKGLAAFSTPVLGIVVVGFLTFSTASLVLIPVLVSGALTFAVLARKLARGQRTGTGRALTDQVEGFRTYLATAEAEQLRFEEGEDIYSRYLPWAVLFDLTERWTKVCRRLVELGRLADEAPSWYYGGPWIWSDASWNMNQLDHHLETAAAPAPDLSGGTGFGGGSSFGGGGGFSGGGGGGGGGGSW